MYLFSLSKVYSIGDQHEPKYCQYSIEPNGVEFVNAYIVDRGQADHDFELVYKFDSYAALDEWGVSEKSLRFMEGFIRDLGLYTDSFKEKFIKTVDEVRMIDEGVFMEVFVKEKERAK